MRYYIDEGRIPVPQFGLSTPAPPFSVSLPVKSTPPEAAAAVPDSGFSYLGLGCTIPRQTFDGESASTICSLCAARLGSDAQDFGQFEELGRDIRNVFFFLGPSLLSYFFAPFRLYL